MRFADEADMSQRENLPRIPLLGLIVSLATLFADVVVGGCREVK